jgi:glycosyltransferase involved in cell wall biosynthesis
VTRLNDCKVSVVIPTFNRATYLVNALESVISQTCAPLEIIVVDDGSTDNTADLAARFGDQIRYLTQQNSGPSSARNRGIREAQGDLIAFLDSDDVWLKEKLELQIEQFARKQFLGLVATGYFSCDENLAHPVQVPRPLLSVAVSKEILIRNPWPTPSVMVSRRCFDTVGLFDEGLQFAEDWDMWIRIARRFPTETLNKPLVLIRKHQECLSGSAERKMHNFEVWLDLIHRNQLRYSGGRIVYIKALSWYYFNLSYHYQELGDRRNESRYLAKSIALWPFFVPKRALALARSLIARSIL